MSLKKFALTEGYIFDKPIVRFYLIKTIRPTSISLIQLINEKKGQVLSDNSLAYD